MNQLVLPDGQPFRLCLEAGKSDSMLVLTYAEFGRRPRENQSGGTDHGTANAHFVLGGRVKGGLYGQHPQLDRLDGNLAFAVDFRSLYAIVLEGLVGLAVGGRAGRPICVTSADQSWRRA